ncbi:MAG: competence/damage-inducible protein A [Verrucomicrobia bacterium]|nr:competence/damage-inducible protein A [Verrucomicrobiota bacterium]
MNVEVVNTGTEILLGSVINTHLATLAAGLFPLGLRIKRQVTVPDGDAIREALATALARAEIVIATGGLGPTTDDFTREITAELLGRPLHFNQEIMNVIAARFALRGFTLTERISRQAQVPEGATVLPNDNGTAPGLYLTHETNGRTVHLFLLPGPPRELKPMFEESVLPILRGLVSGTAAINECRIYHVLGMGESNVEALVGEALLALPGLELGYCARPGEVDIRCIGPAETLEAAEKIVVEALGGQIVTRDGRNLEQAVVQALTRRKETLALAESCTGGGLANHVTNVSGASAVFLAGYVTYANEAKTRDLEVDAALIATHGAVSREVAAAMAEGALRRAGSDWALATTGIAGPTGGTEAKPVGTVCIALARRDGSTTVEQHRFFRDRELFKDLAARTALALLLRKLESI